ncbi:unnamed protein product [Protopolystoma xenopodis]|uniref:BOP1 N-terminal domain-containing protein n=1 Tax=Protopolystoma xenopodis TaxID=117903 RepID=A0A448WQ35_9PLAT|nr:unnamed protein product [Protopolystoma xenopodis]
MRDLSSVWSLIELAAPLFPSQRASPMTSLIPPPIFSEYDFDSSDEEDVRNTVGNIPLQWYDKLAHLGYDVTGRPLMKPGAFTDPKDSIDKFIDFTGDPDSLWRTISDPLTGQTVVLTDTDIEIATKLASGKGITGDTETPFEEWNEWFSSDTMLTPISARPPVKRNFLPSVLDKRKVGRMVHAIKMGWMTPRLPSWAISDPNDLGALRRYAACTASGGTAVIDSDDDDSSFFLGFPSSLLSTHIFSDVWESQHSKDHNLPIASTAESEWRRRLPLALQNYRPPRPSPYQRAAEEPLPGHGASYNPAPEFLLSKDES